MDNLDLIIREKQAELQGLQASLDEALTGIESPDYERAAGLQSALYGLMAEIDLLWHLRMVKPVAQGFPSYLSRLLTDDTVTTLELWTNIQDHWSDITTRVLEIKKGKTGHRISCTLQFGETAQAHLHDEYTSAELQRLGWKAGRKRTFYFKTRLQSPDSFDAFCHMMSVIMLEPLASLWKHGQQYYHFN